MKLSKEKAKEYRDFLYSARHEMASIALIALVDHELEKVKDNAITPGAGDIENLRGQAVALRTVLKFLTDSPTSTVKV